MPIGFLRPFPAVVLVVTAIVRIRFVGFVVQVLVVVVVIVATALVLPISFVVPIVEKNLNFVKMTPPP